MQTVWQSLPFLRGALPSETPPDPQEYGLVLLHDDTIEDGKVLSESLYIIVDIIAVHGLGANKDYAWLKKKDLPRGITKDVNWLKSLLPVTLRSATPAVRARIFCFNYDSRWLGRDTCTNTLTTTSDGLVDALGRKDHQDRPLLFIGHSYGGLVVEKAIIRLTTRSADLRELSKWICGVVLLGTPHRGSKAQKWGAILARAAAAIHYGEHGGPMDAVSEDSSETWDLVDAFVTFMREAGLSDAKAGVVFSETKESNYGRRIGVNWKEMVVPRESSAIPGFYNLDLDTDHFGLNKFGRADDGMYERLSGNILRIAQSAHSNVPHRRVVTQKRSIFEVPNTLVDYFVGREDVLLEVENVFRADVPRGPRILVLHGLGGQGKTQIALQYCEQCKDMPGRARDIFWVDASSKTAIESSLESLYGILEGNNGALKKTKPRIEFVMRHFREASTDWLFVYDNFDNPAEVPNFKKAYVPVSRRGSVLITTRDKSVRSLINALGGKAIDLEGLDATSAVNLLLTRSDLQRTEDNVIHAGKIIEKMNSHPLALTQAAAYMKSSHIKLNDFLAHYNTQKAAILQQTPKLTQYTRNLNGSEETALNVFTTWNLSFEQLEDFKGKDCVESKLLTFLAFFHNQDISEFYFSFIPAMLSHIEMMEGEELLAIVSWFKALVGENGDWSRWKFMDAITTLDELSLIQQVGLVTGSSSLWNTITLHPLVKDWIRLRAGDIACRNNTISASILLRVAFMIQNEESSFRLNEKALQSHVITQYENYKDFFSQGQLSLYEQSTVAASYTAQDSMALIVRSEISHEVGEQWIQRVTQGRVRDLGKEYFDTLASVGSTVGVIEHRVRWECKEAELCYRRALESSEIVHGKEHRITLTIVSNLANVVELQGRYEEAATLCRRVLDGIEEILGEEHPDTLVSAGNLASLLCCTMQYDEADTLFKRACNGLETSLGPGHPTTLLYKEAYMQCQQTYYEWESEQFEEEDICEQTYYEWESEQFEEEDICEQIEKKDMLTEWPRSAKRKASF